MNYPDSLEQAADFLRQAVPLLTRHQLAATPLNYALVYGYVSQRPPELHPALDALLDGHTPEPTRLAALYREYLAPPGESKVHELRGAVLAALASVQTQLKVTRNEAEGYQQTLSKRAASLAGPLNEQQLDGFVQELLHDVQAMALNTRKLEERLDAANSEVESVRAQLDDVREQAVTDALTGLANRHRFGTAIAEMVHTAAEPGRTLALLMIDLDHFKRVNDTHGHVTGDAVLRYTAETVRRCVKGSDLAARYGGEEIAVLLPDTGLEGACALAEQIRAKLSAQPLRKKDSKETIGVITASLGVALYRPAESAEQFIERADQALYRAKAGGRNRVEREAS
jgi:diguanylate cyclase